MAGQGGSAGGISGALLLKPLLDAIPHPAFIQDRGARYIASNRAFEECTGFKIEELAGKTTRDLENGPLRERHRRFERALLTEPGTPASEARIEFADGSLHDVIITRSVFNDQSGKPAGTIGMILDVTERRRAEAELMLEADIKTALAEVSRLLLAEASIEDISEHVLRYAKDLTGSRFGFVGYIDPKTGHLVAATMTRDVWKRCKVPDKSTIFTKFGGLWGWVLDNRCSLLTNHPAEDARSSGVPPGHIPIDNFLAAPAIAGQTLVGIVTLANSERAYTEMDQASVESLAGSYALAIQRMWMEEELQHAKEFAENIIETADAIVVLRDLQGSIWMFNRAAEEATGYKRDEVIGRNWFDLIVPRNRYPEPWARFEEFREGRAFEREPFANPILTRSGEERYISWRSNEVREHGQVIGLISIGTDITERRRAVEDLKESEDKYRTLFETSSDGVFLASAGGAIIDCNPCALEMSGYAREEFVGHDITEFIQAEALLENPELIKRISSSSEAPVETTAVRKDGVEIRVEIVAQRVTLRNEETIIGYVRDISERKRREEQLEELNRELQAFASTLSHDLKSPLGSALGYAATLRRIYADRLDETGKEGLDVMVSSLEKINGIIEGMLEYTRAGRAGERQEEIVVGLIVEGIVQEMREGGLLGGIDFSIAGELPVVTGDSLRLYQVLTNLISNAAKFTAGRPDAAVEVGYLKRGSHGALYVKDNGPGIPPDELEKVFEPLARTEDALHLPGHGLGLAIVKRAVEGWGGQVWVESAYGGGATFFFTVP